MPITEELPARREELVSVLSQPQWVAVFMALSVAVSLGVLLIGFIAGLSVANTSVFGGYALISGVIADVVLRRWLRKVLVVYGSPRVPFIALWFVLCMYVIVFAPF